MSRPSEIVLLSTITCSECGHESEETMPVDSCTYYFECPGCRQLLKPLAGDCCVFCSYGTHPCPSIQAATHRSSDP